MTQTYGIWVSKDIALIFYVYSLLNIINISFFQIYSIILYDSSASAKLNYFLYLNNFFKIVTWSIAI